MSGIVGILNRDGAPVDWLLLQRMTESLRFRGPDAQELWSEGPVGFGHTLLRTTEESATERQPWSLDGGYFITADARIDGRDELLAKLKAKGSALLAGVPDVQLILHAYRAWGEGCLEHLIGDFAFAIWDAVERRLFCARDHFGVKPFYYADLPHCLVFSNTLNCVRLHPDVSGELNRQVIECFLEGQGCSDPTITAFAQIQRLPAAHRLRWSESEGTARMERYWTLPQDEPIRYARASEYIDQFRALLRQAVADRLRTGNVVVTLSGGLDSTTIAAVARQVLARRYPAFELHAHTAVYDRLIPDRERHYAGLVARYLGIPIHYHVIDDYLPYDQWERPELHAPEPVVNPLRRSGMELWKQMATRSRVVLCGHGPDDLLRFPFGRHLAGLWRERRYGRLLVDLGQYVRVHRRLSKRRVRALLARGTAARTNPPAVRPESRPMAPLRGALDGGESPSRERQAAWEAIAGPFWSFELEGNDPGLSLVPLEPRFPFFDLRLVRYLLALPPIPWCLNKTLLRRAMRGMLPDPILRRAKAPLPADPVVVHFQQDAARWIEHHEPSPALVNYVSPDMFPLRLDRGNCAGENLWRPLRILSLDLWLRQQTSGTLDSTEGGMHERCSREFRKEDLSRAAIVDLW
jgi:asparagine synthase (glutamine-hydrolysing)